jgi:pyruvate kinase
VPLLVMTASKSVARRMGLVWGVHAVNTRDVTSFEEMVAKAKRMALRTRLAGATQRLIILAGIPFGTTGSTNVIHVAQLVGDELDDYAGA